MQDKRPICAIATAPGQGAIGVVRVSAPEPDIITALAADILGPERRLVARKAAYGPFLAADAQPIDYGLALWFPAPHSYTGEHILELQGHGGPVVQQILLRRVLQVGAAFGIRLAEPGEFTERAFLNDKLDLVQAEAVADLIEASTEQAARSATRSLQGVFSRQIDDLAEQLLTLRMLVEATLDFPEEEIDFLQKADAAGRLARIDDTLRRLFDTAQSGARLRQGLNVVLTGAPNVGKSSLLNALAGAEVAIVTPIAGTTRDRVIEQISIEGVPINLIDTAGLRDTDDVVEQIGIERSRKAVAEADVALILIDPREGVNAKTQAILNSLPEGLKKIEIHNKADLTGEPVAVRSDGLAQTGADTVISLSAKTGAGLDLLKHALLQEVGWQGESESLFLARSRHLNALHEAEAELENAALCNNNQIELFAEHLRLAQNACSEITGEFTADDLLGVIFSRFCIGK